MKRQLLRALTLWKDDRGMALPLALMALMVLGALSAALLTIGGSEVQISYNHLRGTQAQFMAEAGMEDAFNYYRSDTSRLPAFNATISSTFTDISSSLSGPGTALQDYGNYTVTSRVLGPNTVLVTSTGTSKIGSSQKVLRAIITNGFASDDAIRTKGDFSSSGGDAKVLGSCGSVHTNDDYTKDGTATPTFDEGLTATGTAASPGTGGKPQKLIPKINTSDFWTAAKDSKPAAELFQYESNGRVLNSTGGEIATVADGARYPPAPGPPGGWTYRATASEGVTCALPCWTISGGTSPPNATYYFKTDVEISGGGTSTMTVLATGNITTSGNFSLAPHLTDTLLVSDKDIAMGGASGSTGSGLIAAHEQIEAFGNVGIIGSVLAEDAATTSSLVTVTKIRGSAKVTYDCDKAPPIKGPVRYLAWGF